ncbi:MAG: GH3 auxin-responsive promoter family protein [Bacteroidales bacterium]|nr:GH3 auxin-responsive promoter family protein [Bacteroidales bacterium]
MNTRPSIFKLLTKNRMNFLRRYAPNGASIQYLQWQYLIKKATKTEFGKKYHFDQIISVKEFQDKVPIHTYEDLAPYIERMMTGEKNILWPTPVKWFSKSSGTTNAKSKFIPVSKEALWNCHYKGGKDLYLFYSHAYPDTRILSGLSLALGGSLTSLPNGIETGDVSAILMKNLPFWVARKRTPSLEIALMKEWESKLEKISAQAIAHPNISDISGVPSWMLLLLRSILEKTKAQNISEVFPQLEVFFHGGVNFSPYKKQLQQVIGNPDMRFWETYNASEGFFSMQSEPDKDMLLMLDYGVFYEFLPLSELSNEKPRALMLNEVEAGKNYALVISTNAGLWRYLIGDTILVTSLSPLRIKISGRTKNFINTFGEELMIDNAEKALLYACEHTGAIVTEYTAGPVYLTSTGTTARVSAATNADVSNSNARHQWLIEFEKEPSSIEKFTLFLDEMLQKVNSDYEAKRYKNMILGLPEIIVLPGGTFYGWLKSKERLGGQYKIPRLSNNRDIIEDILKIHRQQS